MSYWTNRQEQLKKTAEKDEAKLKKRLSSFYDAEFKRLEKEIAAYYQQYGEDNVISYRNMLQSLSDEDRRLLMERMDEFAKKYPQYANLMPVRESIYKLDRLQGLQYSVYMTEAEIAGYTNEQMTEHLTKLSQKGVNYGMETLGFGKNFYSINSDVVKQFVDVPWCNGENFSTRIWNDTQKLAQYLTQDLAQGFARGDNYDKLVRNLRQRFGRVNRKDAYRLVYTEGTYVMAEATMQPFKDNFEKYRLSPVLDGKTCPICRGLREQVFLISERQPGVNFPPIHPWCRCSWEIVVDDWDAWMNEYVTKHSGDKKQAEKQADKIAENLNDDKKDAIIKPPKRKQYEPYDSLNKKKSNQRALELIQKETGYDEKTAKTVKKYMDEYFGEDYSEFVDGNRQKEVKVIDEALSRMGAYDGEIFRGLEFGSGKRGQEFADRVKVGGEIEMKSISSWSSERWVADKFAGVGNDSYYSVVFVCKDNKTGVGVQHISEFGKDEAEVLSPSGTRWKITNISQKDKTRTNIMGNKVPVTDVSGNILKEVIVEVTEV